MKGSESLFRYPGVVKIKRGVKTRRGVETGEPAVVVSVKQKKDISCLGVSEIIPPTFNGVATDVVEEGPIKALNDVESPPSDPDVKKWYRPAFGGLSIGHMDVTAGTLGCIIKIGNDRFILSNKHVLGNCNEGKIGDPVYQPGPYDGKCAKKHLLSYYRAGCKLQYVNSPSQCAISNRIVNHLNLLAEHLGRQTRFRAVVEFPINFTDWAYAGPVSEEEAINHIAYIGPVHHVMLTPPYVGMPFKYTGRTSGFKTGIVTAIDVSIRVEMGNNHDAIFDDQIEFQPCALGGDSGSAMLVNSNDIADNIIFGLLFAGSGQFGYACKASRVWSEAGIDWPGCMLAK